MKKQTLSATETVAKSCQRTKRLHKVVICLAAIVVFGTTYALILPAITMEQTAYCNQEAHQHSAACYAKQLICGYDTKAAPAHTHTEECYQTQDVLTCTQSEAPGHVHDESCVQTTKVLVCSNETEEHEHSEDCYRIEETYICGMAAGEGGHTHGPECYEAQQILVCDESEMAHIHSDACYKGVLICDKEEHEHSLACYSDPSADVESPAVWERTFSDVKLTGAWSDDVVAIATSQLGYQESTNNYTVTEDGKVKGYTRYGAWYGDPYGDWCAMFVSFCLHYAEVEDFPVSSNCDQWIEMLSEEPYTLYYEADTYTPQPGDLIFFDWNDNDASDHVGIVAEIIPATETEPVKLKTIEGNSSKRVKYVTYSMDDDRILGYGGIPENPAQLEEEILLFEGTATEAESAYESEENEDIYIYAEAHYDESGELVCSLDESDGHQHNDSCYAAEETDAVLIDQTEALIPDADESVNVCGKEAHTHDEICYDAGGELICGLEEHQHSETCQTAAADSELTEDEQAQVDEVIALIDTLPSSEEVEAALAAFDEAEDADGYAAYYTEIQEQCLAAYDQYNALTEAQQEQITNIEKLMALSWLWSVPSEDENFSLAAQTESGIDVTVSGLLESLPYPLEELTLAATEIDNRAAEQLRDQALEDEGLTAEKNYLFDVTLWHDDQPVEPLGPVTLTFAGLPLEESEACKVYHIDEEAEQATDMRAVLDQKANVVLDTDHFSTYSVSLLTAATGSYPMTATHMTTADMYADSDFSEYLLLAHEGDEYFALGGDGNTYEVTITNENTVQYSGTVEQIKNLCWTMSKKWTDLEDDHHRSMIIRNAGTGAYLYPNGNSLLTDTATEVNLWLKNYNDIEHGEYAAVIYPNTDNNFPKIAFGISHTFHTYSSTDSESEAWFYFAKVGDLPYCHVWLDGTDGGIMSLGGAGNTCQEIEQNTTFTLPTTCTAPDKYSYQLKGWYDVEASKYYQPGATVTITQDTVFYADWEPVTYDIGQSNGNPVASLNTNAFITTRVFDYGALFNVQSSDAASDISGAGHDEVWSLTGSSAYNNSSLGFVFRDWDTYFKSISYPVGSETWSGENKGTNPNDNNPDIYSGLYDPSLIDLLFNPSRSVIGKTYVGTGNYLYQYDDETGYYYYDSKLNAASYNQSNSRFYIYDYLERTSDSPKDSKTAKSGRDSDFLPFNSPYANTNRKTVQTYTTENGKSGYQYDAKYDSTEGGITCSPSNAGTNYWFGMSSTIRFYLPNDSASGGSGTLNQSTKRTDMIFKFSGDDDVWVCVDDALVLDIGGLHGVEEGTINFSTGEVWRSTGAGDGETVTHSFSAGEHTLTIYYLERGGSQSNCAIYFNIAPRDYTLELTKTDRDDPDTKLPGAEFTVYTDPECTTVASDLKDADGKTVSNGTFVSDENGQIHCHGLQPGNTYYIKETKAPPGYNGNENVVLELSIAGIVESYQITSQLYVDGKSVAIDDATNNIYLTEDLSTAGQDRTMKYVFSNKSGYELPNTGGPGTHLYTISGIALMALALLYIIRQRRRRREVMR